MNIADVYEWAQALQHRLETIPEAVADCVAYEKDTLLQLRKDELLLGRNSDGDPFTPGYTEDPYFDTPQQADAYYKYKLRAKGIHEARIEHVLPYPDKDDNTPNLRYTRDRYNSNSFHDQMWIRTDRKSLIIGSNFKETSLINAKYHNKVFSLGPGAKMVFWNDILSVHLWRHILGQ
jgi:hypothetical protein